MDSRHNGMADLAWEFEQRIRLATPTYSELLKSLVRVDSGPGCYDGMAEVARLLAKRLALSGFACEELPAPAGHPAPWLGVQARRGGHEGGVLLVGQLDTAWPRGTVQAWPPTVSHGIVRGPGVARSKGGLVAAVAAAEALDAAAVSGPDLVVLLLVGDAEDREPTNDRVIREAAAMTEWAVALDSASHEEVMLAQLRPATDAANALHEAAARIAAELGVEPYTPAGPNHFVAGPLATAGIPVATHAGPIGRDTGTRDEAIDIESLIGRSALLATLIATFRPSAG